MSEISQAGIIMNLKRFLESINWEDLKDKEVEEDVVAIIKNFASII